MRILMLGNSFTTANHLPDLLAERTGAQVVCHARGGARLAEQLNPAARLGARTLASLAEKSWDYVILQEMSHGPFTAPERFCDSVRRLSRVIRDAGGVPVLFATWAYHRDCPKLAAKGWDYDGMARGLREACDRAARESGALLAPVGQRFYEAGGGAELYAADGIHPSEAGSRLAADTLAGVILQHRRNTAHDS